MNHTFLFKEGLWTAEGCYFDEGNNRISMKGEIRITHTEKFWLMERHMIMLEGNRPEFVNSYEIIPFEKYSEFTTWRSSHPELGTLNGTFVIVEDSMISLYSSDKGNVNGAEYLLKLSNLVYKCRGCQFQGNIKTSSWAVTLYKFE